MAVKTYTPLVVQLQCFLSRLCGGEAADILGLAHIAFLSRLCGGEVLTPDNRRWV